MRRPRARAWIMKSSSQVRSGWVCEGVHGLATAGLAKRRPVDARRGQSATAASGVMFACATMSGSLKPSSHEALPERDAARQAARSALVTLRAPHAIGTYSTVEPARGLLGDQSYAQRAPTDASRRASPVWAYVPLATPISGLACASPTPAAPVRRSNVTRTLWS